MNTTVRIKQSEVYKDWHVIDAAGRPLGRVATEAAFLLKGKHKPTYEPHLDDGDFVIVINASQVRLSGNKVAQKTYYRHSGFPGGLKSRTFDEQMEKFPERVLEKAIWGMLPKGPLGKKMFKHLKVYRNANHPHQSQITGSLNAQEARKAAQAELATAVRKLPRLRPLSVPDTEIDAASTPSTPSPAALAAREARARVRGTAPAAPAVEDEVSTPVVDDAPAAEAPATEAAPKRTRRKATDAGTETTAEAPAAAEATETEAPKRASRRKAADADGETESSEATEAKKPRRRAAAKSEGTEE